LKKRAHLPVSRLETALKSLEGAEFISVLPYKREKPGKYIRRYIINCGVTHKNGKFTEKVRFTWQRKLSYQK
jgi:hypothetical protein